MYTRIAKFRVIDYTPHYLRHIEWASEYWGEYIRPTRHMTGTEVGSFHAGTDNQTENQQKLHRNAKKTKPKRIGGT